MNSIRREVTYPHPIETVWHALTDADALSEWFMPTDLKPIEGSSFTFRTQPAPGFDGIVKGQVLEVKAPQRIVLSWSGGPLKETIVTFELREVPSGTQLSFEHRGFSGISNLIPRLVLGRGWRGLLNTRLTAWLKKHSSPGRTSVEKNSEFHPPHR